MEPEQSIYVEAEKVIGTKEVYLLTANSAADPYDTPIRSYLSLEFMSLLDPLDDHDDSWHLDIGPNCLSLNFRAEKLEMGKKYKLILVEAED